MKFGLFYELECPRPWFADTEQRLFDHSLDQIELADRLGIDYLWQTEHHFVEEHTHSSAPECFLAAASQRTKRMRLGQGICILPPRYNHPARVAERVATLDLLSHGRFDFGTGESGSRLELEGFGLDYDEKRGAWLEAIGQIADMLVMTPYPGFDGQFFSMPARNIVPKPVQKPHPPLWVACSNRETINLAAQLGIGALTFSFLDAAEAKKWVDEYYDTFERECVPIGHAVNPQVALFTGFGVHQDYHVAVDRFIDGIRFLQFGLNHFYRTGVHVPGRTDVWAAYQEKRAELIANDYDPNDYHKAVSRGAIGSIEQVRATVRSFADAGVDQLVFLQQPGITQHGHICESLELFAADILPEFAAGELERQARKMARLQPAIEAAFARKKARAPLADAAIAGVPAGNFIKKYGETATLGSVQTA